MSDRAIDLKLALGPFADSSDGFAASEIDELAEAIRRHPPRAIRLHPKISEPPPFDVLPVEWFPGGRLLADSQCMPGAYVHHAAGDYYIQDAGSMLPVALCQLQPGQIVADLCASPGGKSTGLAEMIGEHGLLLANEVISSRCAILQRNVERGGFANTILTNADVGVLAKRLRRQFDCVLVDAPCTGQSMLAKGKQSTSAYSAKQIQHSAARQTRILDAASQLVRPGGRLVYATCSFSYDENEAVVAHFLELSPAWAVEPMEELARWQSPFMEGGYRLWPHRDASAGAFAARLVLTNETTHQQSEYGGAKDGRGRTLCSRNDSATRVRSPIAGCKLRSEHHQLLEIKGSLHFLPAWETLKTVRDIKFSGIQVAEYKGRQWQPAFGASRLPNELLHADRELVITDEQAQQFIQGQSVGCDSSLSGWFRIVWRNRPLSWGKLSAGQCKNHFPKLLRQNTALV